MATNRFAIFARQRLGALAIFGRQRSDGAPPTPGMPVPEPNVAQPTMRDAVVRQTHRLASVALEAIPTSASSAPIVWPTPIFMRAPELRTMHLMAGYSMQKLGRFGIARGERLDFDIVIYEELRGEGAVHLAAIDDSPDVEVEPEPLIENGVMKVWVSAKDFAKRMRVVTVSVGFDTPSGVRRRGNFTLKVS